MNVESIAAPPRAFDRQQTARSLFRPQPRAEEEAQPRAAESTAEPDFLAFLQNRLELDGDDATALLGRWLAEYRPTQAYSIDVLSPRLCDPR